MHWGFLLIFTVIIAGALLVTVGAFLVPDTRSATQSVYLHGTLEQVWAVYTDPGSQADWRDDIQEVAGLRGTNGSRQWMEISSRGIEIAFRETVFDPPAGYGLEFSSEGRFEGSYSAEFQQIEPNRVQVTVTESVTSLGLVPKLLSLIFVRPQQMIEQFATEAQREINRRIVSQ